MRNLRALGCLNDKNNKKCCCIILTLSVTIWTTGHNNNYKNNAITPREKQQQNVKCLQQMSLVIWKKKINLKRIVKLSFKRI